MPAHPRVVLRNRLARASRMQMLQTNAVSGWHAKSGSPLNDTFAYVLKADEHGECNFSADSALRRERPAEFGILNSIGFSTFPKNFNHAGN